jgi:hypothetical protein
MHNDQNLLLHINESRFRYFYLDLTENWMVGCYLHIFTTLVETLFNFID